MNGLATPADIEALADQFTSAANALHTRLLKDIKARAGQPIPDPEQQAMRALLENEVLLREHANALYADAAARVVAGLSASQAHIVSLTSEAAERISKVDRLSHALGIAAALAALSGAAMTGQPAAIALALEQLYHGLQAKPPA